MRLIDMHCDTIYELMKRDGEGLKENSLCVNLNYLKEAGSSAQFFACFLYAKEFEGDYGKAYERALTMLSYAKKETEVNANELAPAFSFEDYIQNQKGGKISAFYTIEEGGILEGKMERLELLFQEGVRLMTLTWNFENCIGYPNKMSGGLKPFGIDVVNRMNDLGMIIDVSHLSDDGFWDVMKYSKKPIVASHSNARKLCNHPRNLTDEMIKVLAENGGIMGINFYPYFIHKSGHATIENIVEHVQHIYQIGGEDVIAIGTDFDGFDEGTSEISNIGQINLVKEALEKKGFTQRQVEKIWHGNAEQLLKDTLTNKKRGIQYGSNG